MRQKKRIKSPEKYKIHQNKTPIHRFVHSSQQVTVYAYNPNRTESLITARAIGFHRLRVTYVFSIYVCLFNSPVLIAPAVNTYKLWK